MPIQILMPALSPTMTSGNLTKWHKKEGDLVKPGEVIAEVETDKATMEVEAVDEGKLARILVPEQTNDVAVNSLIAILLEEDEDESSLQNFAAKVPEVKPQAVETPVAVAAQQPTIKACDKVFASPLARRIAEQNNVSLGTVSGSGPNGRIVKADVLGFLENKPAAPQNIPAVGSHTLQPHTTMRKVIASRLLESKQTIPHFYLSIECRLDNLIALREQINRDSDAKISINDFIIKATALAMKAKSGVNSSWTEQGIKKYGSIDISVAVSVDDGLITPIVFNADARALSDISATMKDLAVRARENKLKPEEFQGGNFTISNLGMYGIKQFCAIINPPQSCILAIGATNKMPVINGDKVEVASIMEVTLSCDHRVVDGVLGAQFLQAFKNYLENPIKMLV